MGGLVSSRRRNTKAEAVASPREACAAAPPSGSPAQVCLAEVGDLDAEAASLSEAQSWRAASLRAPECPPRPLRSSPFIALSQRTRPGYMLLAPCEPARQDRAAQRPQRMAGHASRSRQQRVGVRTATAVELQLEPVSPVDVSPTRAAAALCKQAQCCRSPFQRYAQSATLAGHETSASPEGRRPAIIDCEIEPVDGWNLENCSPQRSPAQKSVRSPQLGAHAFGRRSGRSNGQLSPFKTGSPSAGLPRGSIAFDSDQAPWDGELQLDDDVVNPIAPFFRSPRAHAHVVSIER